MKTTLIVLALSLTAIHVSASPVAARAPSNMICNKSGWDVNKESFASTDGYTYPDCSAACFATSKCKSFAYRFSFTSGGECQLYDVPVNQNFAPDANSPYTFYDVGCEKSVRICGDEGLYTGREWDVIGAADTYSRPPSEKTPSACYKMCKDTPNCKAYSWYEHSCITYDVPLSGNFNKTFDGWTTFFYDLSCGDPTRFQSPPLATSSSATTIQKTTTSATTQTTNSIPTKTSKTVTTTSVTLFKNFAILSTTTVAKSPTVTPSTSTKTLINTSTTTLAVKLM